MLGPQDWENLATGGPGTPGAAKLAIQAILDLHDQLAEHAAVLEDIQNETSNKAKFNVRLEALKAAREHIAALEPEHANPRGYRATAAERIAQELKVARYLLMEDEC